MSIRPSGENKYLNITLQADGKFSVENQKEKPPGGALATLQKIESIIKEGKSVADSSLAEYKSLDSGQLQRKLLVKAKVIKDSHLKKLSFFQRLVRTLVPKKDSVSATYKRIAALTANHKPLTHSVALQTLRTMANNMRKRDYAEHLKEGMKYEAKLIIEEQEHTNVTRIKQLLFGGAIFVKKDPIKTEYEQVVSLTEKSFLKVNEDTEEIVPTPKSKDEQLQSAKKLGYKGDNHLHAVEYRDRLATLAGLIVTLGEMPEKYITRDQNQTLLPSLMKLKELPEAEKKKFDSKFEEAFTNDETLINRMELARAEGKNFSKEDGAHLMAFLKEILPL